MIDAITNKSSIFYTERAKFDFLLREHGKYWFSSGTAGLHRLSNELMACYTAERKINYLNDLAKFIMENKDKISGFKEAIDGIIEHYVHFSRFGNLDHFGTYLLVSCTYNHNNIPERLEEALLNALSSMDLENIFNHTVFYNPIHYAKWLNSRYSDIKFHYTYLKEYIKHVTNEDQLTIHNLNSALDELNCINYDYNKTKWLRNHFNDDSIEYIPYKQLDNRKYYDYSKRNKLYDKNNPSRSRAKTDMPAHIRYGGSDVEQLGRQLFG